ncbi:MAG TPA: hypothetical protein PLT32_00430 [bacterium]|nr:hypothetical protein [bacterium]
MDYQIVLKIDKEKDAWNWWHAANHPSHGVAWSERIAQREIKEIIGLDQATAGNILLPFLDKYYQENQDLLNSQLKVGQDLFNQKGQAAINKVVEIFGRPLYRDNFVGFLTTFPRCPYNYEAGYFWLCALWPAKCYLGTFLHELLHFQFIFYYQAEILPLLGKEKFERLKESLTVILNDEFRDFLCQSDQGYAIDQALRQRLFEKWQEDKSIDRLIDFGVMLTVDSKLSTK